MSGQYDGSTLTAWDDEELFDRLWEVAYDICEKYASAPETLSEFRAYFGEKIDELLGELADDPDRFRATAG